MFFYKGIHCPLSGLQRVELDTYIDEGWLISDLYDHKVYYKGYSTDCDIGSCLYKIIFEKYKPAGKWCVIYGEQIFHPILRGYPIYKIKSDLTNIPGLSDDLIHSEERKTLSYEPISLENASELIGNILIENIYNFLKYQNIEDLNVLYSMGLDSLTIWALVDYLIDWYRLEIYLPGPNKNNTFMGMRREYTNELINHLSKNCWGYKMTSIYANKNWYTTGFYSERIQLREVTSGHAIAKFLKTELHKMVKKEDYLYYFLQRPECKRNTCDVDFQDEKEVKDFCFNSIFHDYQMWHIDNNMHFSPFYDQRIAEICVRLNLEDLVKNAANGVIQKNIIKKYNPQLLCLLSDYKNEQNIYKNFRQNWHKIKLSNTIDINIT